MTMRSDAEMYSLIIETALSDERIRAVLLNGSRANPNAPKDIFQDFDVIYLVTNIPAFTQDPRWIDRFGELMILQLPDTMSDPPPTDQPGFCYLMQFVDGTRIDLNLFPVARIAELEQDSLTRVLLDKDDLFPSVEPASERGYLPKRPAPKAFDDCCNEFWWVSPYVAKGLWRGQILYAKLMLDEYVRAMLMKMLVWRIGVATDFSINPGKYGKYYQRYLAPDEWSLLMKTFSDADEEHTWEALFAMCELFRKVAGLVANRFGYNYPYGDDERVSAYLRHVHRLPRDADAIY